MKRSSWLIVGILIVMILLAIFVFLLFRHNQGVGIFPGFPEGGEGGGGTVVTPTPTTLPEPEINNSRPRLRQLTINPVAGFSEVITASVPTPKWSVHYVEAGTGHIYQIDLDTGTENRLSNITIAGASDARLASNGLLVAVKDSNERRHTPLTLITLEATGPKATKLEAAVTDFAFLATNELVYTQHTPTGLQGLVASTTNPTSAKNLFTLPFYDVTIAWGKTATGTHFVTNRPSYLLEGYQYRLTNGSLKREPAAGFGFSSIVGERHIWASYNNAGRLQNERINRRDGTTVTLPIRIFSEKCTLSNGEIERLWCAYSEAPMFEFPDAWYKGAVTFSDSIWYLADDGSSTKLVDTLAESGREIDIMDLTLSENEKALFFVNKNDNTLWLYEL